MSILHRLTQGDGTGAAIDGAVSGTAAEIGSVLKVKARDAGNAPIMPRIGLPGLRRSQAVAAINIVCDLIETA